MDIVSSRALRWVAVVALGIASAHAADWSVQPLLVVGTDYDSNRTLASDATGSEGVSMSGNMRLVHATERLQLLLLPELALQRFSDRRFDRSDNDALSARATWTGMLTSFDLSASLRDQSTLSSELLSTGIFDLHTRRRDEQIGGTWSYAYAERWGVSLFSSYESQNYHGNATTPLQDNRLTTFGLSEKYIATQRLSFTASASSGHYVTEQSSFDTRSDSASAGFILSLSERNQITGDFGWNRRTDQFSRSSGFVGQLLVSRSSETGSLSFSAGRSVVPSGFGVFSQMDQVLLSASRGLSERLTLGAALSWYRTQSAFRSVTFDDRSYSQVRVSLTWRADPYWSIGAQLEGNRADSTLSADPIAQGWRAGLVATWQPLERGLSR